MQARIIMRTIKLCVVMFCEFLRIETPVTKLSMNRANQRIITSAFITQASRITLGFPFHFSERAIDLEDTPPANVGHFLF